MRKTQMKDKRNAILCKNEIVNNNKICRPDYCAQAHRPQSRSHTSDIAKVLYNAQRTEDELVFSCI